MNRQEAKKLIENTFSSDFNADKYQKFVANLFKKYSESNFSPIFKDAYKPFIVKYKIIGTFKDSEDNEIDILEVYLSKESTLERARTAQRNFVAECLKSRNKEAALVAFISPNNKEWRLSLVKLEHSLIVVDEKLKTKEEITPAKRWSFLVGENEGSHTAQSRFVDLIVSDEDPNLKELEQAFDIETVTKEFFNKYTELFFQLKDHLDDLLEKDEIIKKDFEEKEISTVDFAKKTLGQIVFLYFLQKKGWFGVAHDKQWGEGPKKFLRELFKARDKYGKNFFNDILEPLFYEALAQDRGKESIYPKLNNCRMPFLNGGLFEPMLNYSWETTDIIIPDELFSNKKDGNDEGTGILDIFDRYNFTVNENEPLEKEVAVDPEMLGKVFENLLDIKDRKSKGAFYTPREIVHYMCQESLINYLETETKNAISHDDLELFIQKGDRIIENDKITLERKEERDKKYGTDKYQDKTYSLLLPESVRAKAVELDELLQNIKVADPAVGSGAFPLGMINEIVRARKVLNVYIKNDIPDYELKKHTITHSIYGVDIDPGAVDIAKLRLWLALVVDEETPHPLPNLEHKIMQGNSLISEYEGIKLFDDSFFEDAQDIEKEKTEINTKLSILQKKYFELHKNNELTAIKKTEIEKEIKPLHRRLKSLTEKRDNSNEAMGLFDLPQKKKIAQEKTRILQGKIEAYISESRRTQKQNLKEEIDNLKWGLIEATLEEQGKTDKLEEIKKLRHKNIKPFFIWKLEFSDVFKEKGGFDVVIGNPPYVGEKGNKEIFRQIAKGNLGKYYQGKMDLFYFFFHLALDLGRENTQNAFITTNYYITALGAKKFRADLKERSSILNLINFNELRIFESALGQHNMITIFSKGQDDEIKAKTCITKRTGIANEKIINSIINGSDTNTDYYEMPQKELYSGNNIKLTSGGLDNILDKIAKNIRLKKIANVNAGVQTSADKFTDKHHKNYPQILAKKGEGIFIFPLGQLKKIVKNEGLIKPWFKNSDATKWSTNNVNKSELLLSNFIANKEQEPDVIEYLTRFKEILINRSQPEHMLDWWDLHQIRMKDKNKTGEIKKMIFDGPKIVNKSLQLYNDFAYNDTPWYAPSGAMGGIFYITIKEDLNISLKYLLGVLNSKLIYSWLYNRGKRKGKMLALSGTPLSEIPIKEISLDSQKPFIDLVDKTIDITSSPEYDTKNPPIKQKELEKKIDEMVYELYGLTEEEIKIIEESSRK